MDFPATQAIDDEDFCSTQNVAPQTERVEDVLIGTLHLDNKVYPIRSGITSIGRHPHCKIVINHETISKKHAEIDAENLRTIFIKDLKSCNRTKINNAILRAEVFYQLKDGDDLAFGKINAKFQIYKDVDDTVISSQKDKKHSAVIPDTPDCSLNASAASDIDLSSIPTSQAPKSESCFRVPNIPQRLSTGSTKQAAPAVAEIPELNASDLPSILQNDSFNNQDTSRSGSISNQHTSLKTAVTTTSVSNLDNSDDENIFDMETQRPNDIENIETQKFEFQKPISNILQKSNEEISIENLETQPYINASCSSNKNIDIETLETQRFEGNESSNKGNSFNEILNERNKSLEDMETQKCDIENLETQCFEQSINNCNKRNSFNCKSNKSKETVEDMETQSYDIENLETQCFEQNFTCNSKSSSIIQSVNKSNNKSLDRSIEDMETQKYNIEDLETQCFEDSSSSKNKSLHDISHKGKSLKVVEVQKYDSNMETSNERKNDSENGAEGIDESICNLATQKIVEVTPFKGNIRTSSPVEFDQLATQKNETLNNCNHNEIIEKQHSKAISLNKSNENHLSLPQKSLSNAHDSSSSDDEVMLESQNVIEDLDIHMYNERIKDINVDTNSTTNNSNEGANSGNTCKRMKNNSRNVPKTKHTVIDNSDSETDEEISYQNLSIEKLYTSKDKILSSENKHVLDSKNKTTEENAISGSDTDEEGVYASRLSDVTRVTGIIKHLNKSVNSDEEDMFENPKSVENNKMDSDSSETDEEKVYDRTKNSLSLNKSSPDKNKHKTEECSNFTNDSNVPATQVLPTHENEMEFEDDIHNAPTQLNKSNISFKVPLPVESSRKQTNEIKADCDDLAPTQVTDELQTQKLNYTDTLILQDGDLDLAPTQVIDELQTQKLNYTDTLILQDGDLDDLDLAPTQVIDTQYEEQVHDFEVQNNITPKRWSCQKTISKDESGTDSSENQKNVKSIKSFEKDLCKILGEQSNEQEIQEHSPVSTQQLTEDLEFSQIEQNAPNVQNCDGSPTFAKRKNLRNSKDNEVSPQLNRRKKQSGKKKPRSLLIDKSPKLLNDTVEKKLLELHQDPNSSVESSNSNSEMMNTQQLCNALESSDDEENNKERSLKTLSRSKLSLNLTKRTSLISNITNSAEKREKTINKVNKEDSKGVGEQLEPFKDDKFSKSKKRSIGNVSKDEELETSSPKTSKKTKKEILTLQELSVVVSPLDKKRRLIKKPARYEDNDDKKPLTNQLNIIKSVQNTNKFVSSSSKGNNLSNSYTSNKSSSEECSIIAPKKSSKAIGSTSDDSESEFEISKLKNFKSKSFVNSTIINKTIDVNMPKKRVQLASQSSKSQESLESSSEDEKMTAPTLSTRRGRQKKMQSFIEPTPNKIQSQSTRKTRSKANNTSNSSESSSLMSVICDGETKTSNSEIKVQRSMRKTRNVSNSKEEVKNSNISEAQEEKLEPSTVSSKRRRNKVNNVQEDSSDGEDFASIKKKSVKASKESQVIRRAVRSVRATSIKNNLKEKNETESDDTDVPSKESQEVAEIFEKSKESKNLLGQTISRLRKRGVKADETNDSTSTEAEFLPKSSKIKRPNEKSVKSSEITNKPINIKKVTKTNRRGNVEKNRTPSPSVTHGLESSGSSKLSLSVSFDSPKRQCLHRILFTGEKSDTNSNIVKKLKATEVNDPTKCTVLVTDKVRRTFKFLCCVAQGTPIVSINWLTDSDRAHKFLNLEDYILKDCEAEKKYKFSLDGSLQKARIQKLLNGYSVLFMSKFQQPPLKELKDMVTCCGGKVLQRAPAKWSNNVLIIIEKEDIEKNKKVLNKAPKTATVHSAEFILTGILRQEINLTEFKLSI